MLHTRYARFWALILLFATGCAGAQSVAVGTPDVQHVEVDGMVAADAQMQALVAPYSERVTAEVSAVIGEATGALEKSSVTMGNFAADALLYGAREMAGEQVDFAVTNTGGLRIPTIAAGPITVERLYELMPFENRVAVLAMTGVEVDSLAQQIARMRGEPVALLSFDVRYGRAENIEVGGAPLETGRIYRVATIDYLANGGGGMPALHTAPVVNQTRVLLREAMIAYVRFRVRVDPLMEERIRLLPN